MFAPCAHTVCILEAPGGILEAPGGTQSHQTGRPHGVTRELRDALVRRFVAARLLDTQRTRVHCPTGQWSRNVILHW